MTALYIVLGFIALTGAVAFGSWVLNCYRDEVARRDGFLADPIFSPLDSPRGRRQFTGRGAMDEECLEPGALPTFAQVYDINGKEITDRDIINELMSGPVASYGDNPVMIPTEQRRRYVGPNSVSDRSADGVVVPFAKPQKRDAPMSRTDAHKPNPAFGLGTTRRSDPVYNTQTPTNYPRLSAPKKAVEPPKPPVKIPANWRIAADNGSVPSYRRDRRAFHAYGKLQMLLGGKA
jgi:hypothetical protein